MAARIETAGEELVVWHRRAGARAAAGRQRGGMDRCVGIETPRAVIDVLARRPDFRDSLYLYGVVLEAWGVWHPSAVRALGWSPEECRERWERGTALIAEAPPAFDPEVLELLAPSRHHLAHPNRLLDDVVRAGMDRPVAMPLR